MWWTKASGFLDNAQTTAINPQAGMNTVLTAGDLLGRRVLKGMGYPANGTKSALVRYLVNGLGEYWLGWPDHLHAYVTPHLFADETATLTQVDPGAILDKGWPDYIGFDRAKNLMVVSDSIAFYGPAKNTDQGYNSYVHDAVAGKYGALTNYNLSREFFNDRFGLVHMGIGGTYIDTAAYAAGHVKQFPQAYKTMSLNRANQSILIALGSNDIAAGGDSAATAWAELSNLIGLFQSEFPLAKVIVATLIRRTETAAINTEIAGLNALIRSNVANVFDLEAAHADFGTTGGNSNSPLYYGDTTHLSAAGISTAATALQTII